MVRTWSNKAAPSLESIDASVCRIIVSLARSSISGPLSANATAIVDTT